MNRYQFELLSKLKQRYIETNGIASFQSENSRSSLSARQFYLADLSDNLVWPVMSTKHLDEYLKGSGDELNRKMNALRSSSAMTFNILGNITCIPNHSEEPLRSNQYKIRYEYQLPTLKRGLPANLDAILFGESGNVIACEMKMLEWLTSTPEKLKDKYIDSEKYIFTESAYIFIEAAHKINASDIFTHYDSAQMFKHSLALYNAIRSESIACNHITLLNCVWEPPEDYDLSEEAYEWISGCVKSEHTGFRGFLQIMQPIEELFSKTCGIEFDIRYITASDLIDKLKYPEDIRAKLQRYI